MTPSLPTQAQVVIVGGGMAGLSCAAALAKRGVSDVVLLEAHTLAHARASSYGETRMFREMYSDPVLCRFCLLYTSPSPRDLSTSRMPSSA